MPRHGCTLIAREAMPDLSQALSADVLSETVTATAPPASAKLRVGALTLLPLGKAQAQSTTSAVARQGMASSLSTARAAMAVHHAGGRRWTTVDDGGRRWTPLDDGKRR